MTERSPTVSVVIPTYNRAHLLGRAIQSVLDQTYQDFELIVVDDGSTDNTEGIVNGFGDHRIRYIRHKENRGAAAARNTGIEAARGEYIAFQDSDDEWLPDKLEKQIRVFENAPQDVGVVYTDMQRINERGEVTYWHSPRVTNGRLINPETLDYQVMGLGIQSTLIRKKCFDVVGLFDEKFPRFIDLDLFIRLSKHYRFVRIEEMLVKYHTAEGISSNANALTVAQELLLEKYCKDVEVNRKFLANQHFTMGIVLCSDGELKRARKHLVKAVKAYPLNIKYLGAAAASLLGQSGYNKVATIYRTIRGWFSKTQ